MAQVQLQPVTAGRKRLKVHSFLKIDMTPMVDLGFLLITFFIFTTTMAEKKVTKLVMPKGGDPIDVPASKSMTFLLAGNNKVYVYEGLWDEAKSQNRIIQTDYNEYKGLGSLIRVKQKQLLAGGKDKDGPIILIKPLESSTYQNVIDALDEMAINDIGRFAIVDATKEDKDYINRE